MSEETLKELVRELAEIERRILAETSDGIDAIVDPSSASVILLRAAQEALVESESRYRRLAVLTSALVFELAPDGTTRFVNEALSALTGYSSGEVLGRNWWDLFCPGEERRGARRERVRRDRSDGRRALDAAQHLQEVRRVERDPVQVLVRDVVGDALVPRHEEVDGAGRADEHTPGPERPRPRGPQPRHTRDVAGVALPADDEHVDVGGLHLGEHPRTPRLPERGVVGEDLRDGHQNGS